MPAITSQEETPMGITVINPHNGEEMKVRDNDAGRAVKDKEGRIFYVLPKSDGSGHYGALTRAGSAKEEARNQEMEEKIKGARKNTEQEWQSRAPSGGGFMKTVMKVIRLLLFLAILAGLGWAVFFGPLKGRIPGLPGSSSSSPAPTGTTTSP
jgi:hypothetical protein